MHFKSPLSLCARRYHTFKMKNSFKYAVLIIISTILGYLTWNAFFELSLTQLSNENINIVSRKISTILYLQSIFALSIGVIPLLYLILKKITNLKFITQGIISLTIIILSGISVWQLKILHLNIKIERLSELNFDKDIQNVMYADGLNFGIYLLTGFIIGTLLSILIFKKRNKISEK